MARNATSGDLEDVFTQNSVDVGNLECQIREILKSMEVVQSIVSVRTITLPETLPDIHRKDFRPETRMEWNRSDDTKKQKTGKMKSDNIQVMPFDNPGAETVDEENTSGLDMLIRCVNENTAKYIPLPESTFFVPVLDSCVFGMSLLNAGISLVAFPIYKKLKKPDITISLLKPSSSDGVNKDLCRSFVYDVHVNLKEFNPKNAKESISEEGLTCQKSVCFEVEPNFDVMPGCEILVTATFKCPMELLLNTGGLRLVVSAYLENNEIWAREIPITNNCFSATYIDNVFKSHHSSIVIALGIQREIFKMERLLCQDEMSPHGSMKRFLLPLGFEIIQTFRTGIDTVIEVYTTNQPSVFWGICVKIEKCTRCQMPRYITVKSVMRSGRMSKRNRCNDLESIDPCWIHDYCKSVEGTDMIFISK